MAPTAILLPGNMCDARLWTNAIRAAFDNVIDADLSLDDTICAMAERTLDATDGILLPLGFSMGAIVAMEMAVMAPDRVCGMILCGFNATADLPDRAAIRPLQQMEVIASGRAQKPDTGLGQGLERVLIEELKPNYLAAANRGNAETLVLLRDMGMTLGPDVFVRQSEALRLRADRVPQLAALRMPVLFVAGAEDTLCPPVWHRRWAMETCTSRYVEIPNAGHMVPLEAPEAFAGVIQHWIQDHRGELGL